MEFEYGKLYELHLMVEIESCDDDNFMLPTGKYTGLLINIEQKKHNKLVIYDFLIGKHVFEIFYDEIIRKIT